MVFSCEALQNDVPKFCIMLMINSTLLRCFCCPERRASQVCSRLLAMNRKAVLRWPVLRWTSKSEEHVQSILRHKDSTVGQHALERTEGDEDSQGRKTLGIPALAWILPARSAEIFHSSALGQQTLNYIRAQRKTHFEYFEAAWARTSPVIRALCAREACAENYEAPSKGYRLGQGQWP